MKLTYWLVACMNDSTAYSIRELRKRDAKRQLDEHKAECKSKTCGTKDALYGDCMGQLQKVIMEYPSAFALLESCLGEDRGMCLVQNEADDC